nr:type I 3-dehydroquinate dehydratase [uncultured Aminipila sp.]
MKTVEIRNLIIGKGMPKICIPIVGATKEEILTEAKSIKDLPVHMVEWRADWFEDIFNFNHVLEVLSQLRTILNEVPLLFTFRTAQEGGEKSIEIAAYAELNKAVARTGFIDLIDVEAFGNDHFIIPIISEAHKQGIKVIASNHDFEKTLSKNEIIRRLIKMQDIGADIAKIALMPQSKHDVLTLLEASLEMSEQHAQIPIVAISMGKDGLISRLTGELFGSAITFGSVKEASAPGQMEAKDLYEIVDLIHNNM